MRKSEILEYGKNNKVLVKWYKTYKDECSIEYSVHSLGLNHTKDSHDLIWGHYFGDDYTTCNEYFNQYR